MTRSHPHPDADTLARFLAWRGIEGDPCPRCHGSGIRTYGSTSTWRGGLGGAMMSSDVCDGCWGSGDSANPWVNLRAFRDQTDHDVNRYAVQRLARAAGANMTSCRAAVESLLTHLDALTSPRRRKRDPEFFVNIVSGLARALRDGIAGVPAVSLADRIGWEPATDEEIARVCAASDDAVRRAVEAGVAQFRTLNEGYAPSLAAVVGLARIVVPAYHDALLLWRATHVEPADDADEAVCRAWYMARDRYLTDTMTLACEVARVVPPDRAWVRAALDASL